MTYLPFTNSIERVCNPTALQARAQKDGYLLLRGLLPREKVREVRMDVLKLCAEAGWVDDQRDLHEAFAVSGIRYVEGQDEYFEVYDRLQQLESFHRLSLHPTLMALCQSLFGEDVLVHSRNIGRIVFPQKEEYTTPAHQDYAQIGGTTETWTAWIPLGDCPMDLGGLAVLSESHVAGLLPHHASIGVGGKAVDTDEMSHKWVSDDFHCGDVLLFHSHTIHKALPNVTGDRVRLSVDYRYQPVSHPIRRDSLAPHYGRVTWEQIYDSWNDTNDQYYWQQQKVLFTEE